jgi:DNA-directed RNA polymerase specialized sigma24 family protein
LRQDKSRPTEDESSVQLVEASSGRTVATLTTNDDPAYICWLAFRRDGDQLAVCRAKGGLRVWDLQRLREGLNKMDSIDREIIALRNFEQLTNSESAAELGLSLGAASKCYVCAQTTSGYSRQYSRTDRRGSVEPARGDDAEPH